MIPVHLAKMRSKQGLTNDISNTTAIGQDRSGMNAISQKLNTQMETSVNNKVRRGLQLRPRLN